MFATPPISNTVLIILKLPFDIIRSEYSSRHLEITYVPRLKPTKETEQFGKILP